MPINRIEDHEVTDFEFFNKSFDNYQQIATKSALYPGQGTMFGFSYCAHKLAGEAGELNEHFGKAMRDDGLLRTEFMSSTGYGAETAYTVIVRKLTPARKEFLIKEIGDCLWYLSALCNELGISLFEAALMNLKKLRSRTERSTLQGSGDNR